MFCLQDMKAFELHPLFARIASFEFISNNSKRIIPHGDGIHMDAPTFLTFTLGCTPPTVLRVCSLLPNHLAEFGVCTTR